MAVDPVTDRIYVANQPGHRLGPRGGIDTRAVADPINGLVYVASEDTNTVVVVRASTETVIATVAVRIGPTALTIDARTGRVCTNVGSGCRSLYLVTASATTVGL